jgi:FkbM family methyltransferase
MFNQCDPNTNGELDFIQSIKDKLNIVFDVGCREDSLLLDLECEAHYFEPNIEFFDQIRSKPNKNKKSFFNNFGLGNIESKLIYHKKHQSFIHRTKTCGQDNDTTIFDVKKAITYIRNNDIEFIDFLKIDVEGYELYVVQGFEDYLSKIKIIQFEYGGTYIDANIRLIDIINKLSTNFTNFNYLDKNKLVPIQDYEDHHQYCNIVCFNREYNIS